MPDRRRRLWTQAHSHFWIAQLLLGAPLALGLLFEPGNRIPAQSGSAHIVLALDNWEARINPELLTIAGQLRPPSREKLGETVLLADGAGHALPVEGLETLPNRVSWRIPDLGLAVEMTADKNRLHIRIQAERDLKFEWPATGHDPSLSALIYSDGEGLYIPLNDPFWRRVSRRDPCRDMHGGLSMPVWSYRWAGGTWTYLAASDLETQLCLSERGGQLAAHASHDFRARDGLPPYEIEIWPGGDSPISPAREYRQWLIEKGRYVMLDQKARANPEVTKLMGAVHAYVFGDGRSLEFLSELARLGVDRMWLGYSEDARESGTLVGRDYIAEAKRLGYLIAPYDTFDNAQDPAAADSSDSIWSSDLFPAGCIVTEKGGIQKGFAGRGCELSSEALALREPEEHNLENRIASRSRPGVNSYFLDSDAFGELFDDYSKDHPMTPELDRKNRLARMRMIADGHRLVLGSEGGTAWSAPVIAFAHGTEAVSNEFLWPLEKDHQRFGGWWPPARPAIFFKPVEPDEDFRKARYDPAYRLPLYQAAFHGSVVSVERWETPLTKFPELFQVRALLELLYDVPSMWSLDLSEVRRDERDFAALYHFFSPLHRAIGELTLTQFNWLTPDRMVQRTRFGDEIELTANFDGATFETLPPLCIEARWLKTGRRERFCPGPLPTPSRARSAGPAHRVFSLKSPQD